MSLLTSPRIVKAIAVVDDRPPEKRGVDREAAIMSFPVIKRGSLGDGWLSPAQHPLQDKQSYLDELNRIRVDIAQAKAELKGYTRELDGIQKEIQAAQEFLCSEDEAVQKARMLHDNAQAEANRMLYNAERKGEELAEQMGNQGYLEGFNKGFEESRQEFISENQPKADLLGDMIARVTSFERDQMAANEQQLLGLALTVARKVIGREVKTDPALIVDMLYESLDNNKREEFIKITLAEDLLPVEAKASKEIRAELQKINPGIDVFVDSDMSPGDCVVETPKGFTDISISTQLNNIGEMLMSEE